jgi:hypothetical protein
MDLIELTADLDGLIVDDDQRAVLRRQQMIRERIADGLTGHQNASSPKTGQAANCLSSSASPPGPRPSAKAVLAVTP